MARATSPPWAAGAANEKGSREAFHWPTPPFASYPAPSEQTETLPCQLMTGSDADRKYTSARLTFFVPDTGVAHLQMPPARTTVAVRFDQFTALILTTPLQAVAAAALGPARRPAEPAGQLEFPCEAERLGRRAARRDDRPRRARPSVSSCSPRTTRTAASSGCSSRARPTPISRSARRSARS